MNTNNIELKRPYDAPMTEAIAIKGQSLLAASFDPGEDGTPLVPAAKQNNEDDWEEE